MKAFGALKVGVIIMYGKTKNKTMKTAILKNKVTGVEVRVHATTEHPDSSYGHEVWVDDENNAYCEVGVTNPFYEIRDDE